MALLNRDLQLRVLRNACDRDLRLQLGIPPGRLCVPVAFSLLLESQLRQAFVGWSYNYELTLASDRFSMIHSVDASCYYQTNSRPSNWSFTWTNEVIMTDQEHACKFEMEQCKAKKQRPIERVKLWFCYDSSKEHPIHKWIGETERQFTMRKQWIKG